ncbi:uncharacterized protein LOC126249515 [Schistocerca nitens]|uniref:uncharacterized protein LOC126249515 n=1 Tax=Schistocerca nitens TaxID=7011 RepID=UPI002117B5AB|nr:uncharacterized protein LOC126249515 [Schistocerca nitens]
MCDEEVNVDIALWQFLQMLDSNERKHWVHPINQRRDIKNYCRLSVNSFEVLLELVGDKIFKKDTNWRCGIPAEERLLITLRVLATGDRFQYVHYNLRVGATTVGKIVAETCTSIWEVLSPLYMMAEPTPEKWASVAERFED